LSGGRGRGGFNAGSPRLSRMRLDGVKGEKEGDEKFVKGGKVKNRQDTAPRQGEGYPGSLLTLSGWPGGT